MAARAGVDRVGVSYGAHAVHELLAHAPLTVLDDIRHLPPALPRLR
jgi:phosphoglycolate phosphatase